MAQPPHYDIEGAIYFVTTRVIKKHSKFSYNDLLIIQNTILNLEVVKELALYAYVIMPDHLHMLVKPGEENLPKIMQKIKGKSSFAIRKGSIWQKGYFDFAIVSEKKFKEKFNYIHCNPVKKGLVKYAEEYTFSSAGGYNEEFGAVYY